MLPKKQMIMTAAKWFYFDLKNKDVNVCEKVIVWLLGEGCKCFIVSLKLSYIGFVFIAT